MAVLATCAHRPPFAPLLCLQHAICCISLTPPAPLCRYFFSKRHKRERAVLAGCAVGNDAPAVAVPLIEALAGPAGVVAACSALIANTLTGVHTSRMCSPLGVCGGGRHLLRRQEHYRS
jgi:hypothetical protein